MTDCDHIFETLDNGDRLCFECDYLIKHMKTATEEIDEFADKFPDHEVIRLDGLDDACVGYVRWGGHQPILVYSISTLFDAWKKDGMDQTDCEEWFEFNVIGAWMGEGTPAFLVDTGGRKSIIRFGGKRLPANQLQLWPTT
jgi:hypothetical protein